MYSKIILTGLLATAVSASSNPMAHAEMKREILQPRQTDVTGGISTECQTALLEVYSSLPSPPPEILSDAIENPQTDPCSFSTPASLSEEYASYQSEVLSWYSENEDEIQSVLEECPILSQYATMVPVCPTDLGGAGGGSSTGTPATNDASETTADASTATDDSESTATDDSESTATEDSTATGGSNTMVTSRSAGGGTGTPTGTAGGASTSTTAPNAGHREGAMSIAAVVVAGFVVLAL